MTLQQMVDDEELIRLQLLLSKFRRTLCRRLYCADLDVLHVGDLTREGFERWLHDLRGLRCCR